MKYLRLLYVLIVCSVCITACNSAGQKKQPENNNATADSGSVKLQLFTAAIRMPVQMDISPDNTHRLFFTDLSGKIWVWKSDSLQQKPFLDIANKLEQKDTSASVRGLFSMAFNPQFSTNRKFYVCYNAPTNIPGNICKLVVSQFTANNSDADVADESSERRVFELEGKDVQELASEIAFGPDGYLYISIGDHGDSTYKNVAQDMDIFSGKLLRIDVNKIPYAIPADNPFVGIKNERPEIWASGFRRLWRFSFDPQTHQLLGGDVGEEKQEEVDVIEKGGNYGWPVKEGDSIHDNKMQINNALYAAPVNTYTHKDGICIIGGNFYYGNAIPFLKNKYVFADFTGSLFTLAKNAKGDWIRSKLKITNQPKETFFLCSCDTDENNEMYVCGFFDTKSGPKGAVYKLVKG
jgi:glucose/arabinose dehydrogenase